MNDTQWLFELESLYAKEELKFEEIKAIHKMIRQDLIHLLGLNLMPIEEEIPVEEIDLSDPGSIGEEKIYTKLRWPKEDEFTPLSVLTGHEGFVTKLHEKVKELQDQEEMERKEEAGEVVHMTPEELDSFMNDSIDEGDMVFMDDPVALEKNMIWNSEENKRVHSFMVQDISEKDLDIDTNAIEKKPKNNRKKSKVTLG